MADEVKTESPIAAPESAPKVDHLAAKKKSGSLEGNSLAIFSGVVCLTIGLGLGRYTGLYALIPLITGVLIGWPFAKFSKGKRKALSLAFAVHAGQFVFVVWYIVFIRVAGPGGVGEVMPAGSWSFFFDLIFLFLASVWIMIAPSLLSVCAIACYQTLMLLINFIQRLSYDSALISEWPATSLSVQIVFRLVCLAILALAVWQLQKLHNQEREVNPLHVT